MSAIGWWLAVLAWLVMPFSVKWMLNAWGLDVEMTWGAYGATYFFFANTWLLAARAAAMGWRHGRVDFYRQAQEVQKLRGKTNGESAGRNKG